MLYLFAVIGFVFGFYAGLMILKGLLRGKSNEELRNNRKLWWKYGWIVWGVAFFGIWLGIVCWRFIAA